MKTVAIIPARGGSKRLPRKNVMLLGGKPLIAHSILYAQQNSDIIDEIIVSTDNDEIKEIALRFGAKVIDRPIHISGDFEPSVSALKHVLQTINTQVQNVILLQATNPLRNKSLLKEAFEKYTIGSYDSLFTVSRNYEKLGRIKNDKFVPYNYTIGQRSQDLEPLYYENGQLYISNSELILENKIIGEDHFPLICNHPYSSVDIDTIDDFVYAEYILKNSNNESIY